MFVKITVGLTFIDLVGKAGEIEIADKNLKEYEEYEDFIEEYKNKI